MEDPAVVVQQKPQDQDKIKTFQIYCEYNKESLVIKHCMLMDVIDRPLTDEEKIIKTGVKKDQSRIMIYFENGAIFAIGKIVKSCIKVWIFKTAPIASAYPLNIIYDVKNLWGEMLEILPDGTNEEG